MMTAFVLSSIIYQCQQYYQYLRNTRSIQTIPAKLKNRANTNCTNKTHNAWCDTGLVWVLRCASLAYYMFSHLCFLCWGISGQTTRGTVFLEGWGYGELYTGCVEKYILRSFLGNLVHWNSFRNWCGCYCLHFPDY